MLCTSLTSILATSYLPLWCEPGLCKKAEWQVKLTRWSLSYVASATLCAHANRFDVQGKELEGEAEGILGMKQAWPSTIRTVKGDHKRFEETYFSAFPVRLSPSCQSPVCSPVLLAACLPVGKP